MAVTKLNVQSQTRFSWKTPVRTMMPDDTDLAAGDISSPYGAVTIVSGDRVLFTGQTTASENGIYLCTGSGNPFVRTADADTSDDVSCGMTVFVEEGDSAGQFWFLATANPITLNTTALSFATLTSSVGSDSVGGDELDIRVETFTGITSPGFDLAQSPFDNDHCLLYKNGLLLTLTNDYSRSGVTIGLVDTPISADVFTCIYFV